MQVIDECLNVIAYTVDERLHRSGHIKYKEKVYRHSLFNVDLLDARNWTLNTILNHMHRSRIDGIENGTSPVAFNDEAYFWK